MKKLIYLTICLMMIPNILSYLEHECNMDEDCLYNFVCLNEKCEHKGYFPPNLSQILLIIIMCGLSMVATSAGVGGGAIYSALLMFIENFTAQVAFPISSFVILVCSVLTFYLGVKDKMLFPEHKFVDYDLVVIFCPLLLLGTKVGVILNKIFPQLLLNFLLIVCIAFSTYKIYKNAMKVRAKEESEIKQATAQTPFQWKDEHDVLRPVRKLTFRSSSSSKLLDPSPIRDRLVPREKEEDELSHDELILKQIDLFYSYNSPIRLVRIKMIVMIEAIMILDQVIEGSDKVPSLFGIKKYLNQIRLGVLVSTGLYSFYSG